MLSDDAVAIIAAVRETASDLEARLNAMQAQQDRLLAGFPDGDPSTHRRYHESVIEWRELRNRIVRDALAKAATAGAVLGIGWIAYAIWVALKMEVMR